jgi:hypothetical protein
VSGKFQILKKVNPLMFSMPRGGFPPHFFTISLPIFTKCGYLLSSLSLKAHLTNTDNESSRERHSKMCEETKDL